MCGRITLRTNLRQIADEFQTTLPGFDITPRYNISPGQLVLAIRNASTRSRELVQLRWGLIPGWAKDNKLAFQCLNARSETVATKPAFRAAYKSRRCLIPADGYFEWLRQGKEKLPYLYEYQEGKLFSIAGLWESWQDPAVTNAEPIQTFTLLTTSANSLAAEVHDRMPVIVHPDDRQPWLDGEQIPLMPFSEEGMTARRVSQVVNNSRNEGAACIASPANESLL